MADSAFAKGLCPHCGGHIEFPVAAAGQTIPCPHCGRALELIAPITREPPGRSKRRRLGIVWLAVLALAAVAGWMIWRSRSAAPPTPSPAGVTHLPPPPATAATTSAPVAEAPAVGIHTNDFAILPFKLEKTPGSSLVYVTGIVRNLGGQQRFGVKINFGLFDTNDQPVGTATDYQAALDAHGDWRFRALVLPSRAASARFQSIAEDR